MIRKKRKKRQNQIYWEGIHDNGRSFIANRTCNEKLRNRIINSRSSKKKEFVATFIHMGAGCEKNQDAPKGTREGKFIIWKN